MITPEVITLGKLSCPVCNGKLTEQNGYRVEDMVCHDCKRYWDESNVGGLRAAHAAALRRVQELEAEVQRLQSIVLHPRPDFMKGDK